MNKNNPACYECPKSKNKLHTWILEGVKAKCVHCGLQLDEDQTLDVWDGRLLKDIK